MSHDGEITIEEVWQLHAILKEGPPDPAATVLEVSSIRRVELLGVRIAVAEGRHKSEAIAEDSEEPKQLQTQ